MRTINAELLAQFASEQLRAFRLLDFDIDSVHYRYTNCDVPLLCDGNLFTSKDFRIENVGYSSNQFVDRMQIEIDDIKAVLRNAFLDGTPQGSSTILMVAVVDSKGSVLDSGSAYTTLFDGEIDDWSLDESKISISITSILTKWAQKTLSKYSASCRWKKFKGTECTYSGGETWCDRTYVRCTALGNTANFGGFRWLPSIVDKEIWWGRIPANE